MPPPADFEAKLLAGDGQASDFFRRAVAISGETVVVTARRDDDGATNTGSAYIFDRSGTTWTETQKLTADDGLLSDTFGESVAIDGDRLVVVANGDDHAGSLSGSAYVVIRDQGTWTQDQKLTAGDGAANDLFGEAVAISGGTIVIGAHGDDDGGSRSGSAYVLVEGNSWSMQQKLTASDGAVDDFFGRAVAVDGDALVVGAYQDDDFGRAASLDGGTVLIGANQDGDNGANAGSAYIFVPSPPPPPVPGLQYWGLIAMATLLAAVMGWRMRRSAAGAQG